jgi:predicted DNA-binding transcriptional regulator YafY
MWAMSRLRSGLSLKAIDIAREFEVSERTAYRDLDFLRDDWRVPLDFDRSRSTFYLTEPTTLLSPVTLSRGELVALFFAEKVLRQYRGTPFEADLASAFRKIVELMPERVSVSPETLDAFLSLDIGPTYTPHAATFAAVLSAHRLRRTALIRYRSLSSGRTTERRIRPYHVFNHHGDWYVAAWDERRAAVRDFALHRIRRLTLTTESYTIPKEFDFRKYVADAFGIEKGTAPVEVAVRFAPRQGPLDPGAEVAPHGAHRGAARRRLRAATPGRRPWRGQAMADAVRPEVEVRAPKRLREEVAASLARALALYGARRPQSRRNELDAAR